METVYLGLGSNLGNREQNIGQAIDLLEKRIGEIAASSSLHSSKPWGFISTNDFLNQVVSVVTDIDPIDLLDLVQGIEMEVGRVRQGSGYSDRVIDIDILFYGTRVFENKRLVVPHPLLHERLFVLEPLAELDPTLVHPLIGKSVEELLALLF